LVDNLHATFEVSSLNCSRDMVFSIWFSICRPNYIQTGAITAKLWRHMDFSRWRI